MKAATKFETVDQYLSTFPAGIKSKLKEMRRIIRSAAPRAEELISYNMPAFKLNGMLVYFAGYKGHIGFYPTSSGIEAFKKELSGYEVSKGTVRFPLDEPLPAGLITSIVKFRILHNTEKIKQAEEEKRKPRANS